MKIEKKLLSNTFYLFLDFLTYSLGGFFFWLIAGKLLSPEHYGIVSISVNLTQGLIGFTLFGIAAALAKLIPEYLERKDERIYGTLTSCLKFIICLNLLVFLIFFLFANQLASSLRVSNLVITLTGLMTLTYSLGLFLGHIMYGFQEMKDLFLTHLMARIIKLIITIFLVFIGFLYLGPILGFLIFSICLILTRFPLLRKRFKPISGLDKRLILKYAFPAFTASMVFLFLHNFQPVILNHFKGLKEVGIYTIAIVIASLPATIPGILNNALFPIVSALSAKKDEAKISELIALILKYSLILTLPIFLILYFHPEFLILLIAKPEFLEASKILFLVSIASIILTIGMVFLNNLYAIGKPLTYNILVVLTVSIFLALAFPLVPRFSYFGLALAYFLASLTLSLSSLSCLNRAIKIKLSYSSLSKIGLANLLLLPFLIFSKPLVVNLFAFICVSMGIGFLYLYFLNLVKVYTKQDLELLVIGLSKLPWLQRLLMNLKLIPKLTS